MDETRMRGAVKLKASIGMFIFALVALVLPAQTDGPGQRYHQKAAGFRRLHGEDPQGLERAGGRRGHRGRRQAGFRQGIRLSGLRKEAALHSHDACPIASNTKLFTAVAAGMLVDEGKLTWDKPVRGSVPAIRFYNDELNNAVTLRDMLSHRTGITRHDTIWYKSDFSRKELFERLQYLEPSEPLRQTFLYNNLMYAAVGYIIELQSGKTWEEFVRQRIFAPLKMNSTSFSVAEMLKQPEHGVPYTERRDSCELYKLPYYEDITGVAPCGAIISNIQDMSHWLIALMNDGKYGGTQVLPPTC